MQEANKSKVTKEIQIQIFLRKILEDSSIFHIYAKP